MQFNPDDFLGGAYEVGSSDGAPVAFMKVLPACGIDATPQIGGYRQGTASAPSQKIGAPAPFV